MYELLAKIEIYRFMIKIDTELFLIKINIYQFVIKIETDRLLSII